MPSRDFPAVAPETPLADLLDRAAQLWPERGVTVFDGRGRRQDRRTYLELRNAAHQTARRWTGLGLAPGDRVLVALPTSWDFLDAWLGALVRGARPVAVAPGAALGAGQAHLDKIDGLVERLGARFVVTRDALRDEAAAVGRAALASRALSAEALRATAETSFEAPRPAGEDTAFLQLTSGSTGVPRAVQIPHRAALHNALASDLAIGVPHGAPTHVWADSMVSWLPLHHDMGLVGCLLLSIYCGHELVLMPPALFLARPRVWLDQLSRRGEVFAPAPNFGYQLCLERLDAEAREGLALGGWRAAMTGAEMVRPDTVRAMVEAFGPHGFRADAFRPCFGLAEATLAVTFDLVGRGLRTRPLPTGGDVDGVSSSVDAEIACLGAPVVDTEVAIVAPDGGRLEDGAIGEVLVRGPGVFTGYWGDPEATAESLRDGWLVTGDLGFVDSGELYLTGRSKDVLILRGHNLMPHEIEWQAEAVTGGGGALRSGAFSVTRDARGELAVLVVETQERDVSEDNRERAADPLSDVGRLRAQALGVTFLSLDDQ
ncbi:MAG: AMP-binding protein, partial [Acidobacteriota bacterium]